MRAALLYTQNVQPRLSSCWSRGTAGASDACAGRRSASLRRGHREERKKGAVCFSKKIRIEEWRHPLDHSLVQRRVSRPICTLPCSTRVAAPAHGHPPALLPPWNWILNEDSGRNAARMLRIFVRFSDVLEVRWYFRTSRMASRMSREVCTKLGSLPRS